MSSFGNLGKALTVATALVATPAAVAAQGINQSQATISSTTSINVNGNEDLSQNKGSNTTSATDSNVNTNPTVSSATQSTQARTGYVDAIAAARLSNTRIPFDPSNNTNSHITSNDTTATTGTTGGPAVGDPLTANGQSAISGGSANSTVNKSRKPTFIVDKDTAFLISNGGKTDYQIMVVKYDLPSKEATTTGHTMPDLPFGNESYDTTGGRLEVLCLNNRPSLSVDANNIANPATTVKAIYNLLKQNAGAVCLNGQPNNDVVVGLVEKIFPQAFPQTIKRVTFTFQPHP